MKPEQEDSESPTHLTLKAVEGKIVLTLSHTSPVLKQNKLCNFITTYRTSAKLHCHIIS